MWFSQADRRLSSASIPGAGPAQTRNAGGNLMGRTDGLAAKNEAEWKLEPLGTVWPCVCGLRQNAGKRA
jgi:hypothetical protein